MSNETKFVLLIILSVTTIFSGLAVKKPSKILYFNSAEVSFNSLYLQDHQLITKNATLDVVLNVAQNFKRDPWALIILAIKKGKSDNYRSLIQYDVNICNLLGRDGQNVLSIWMQNFLKYGNLPKSCPILKGNYTWRNLKADKLSIPDFMPVSQYKIEIDSYFPKDNAKESVANLTLFAILK